MSIVIPLKEERRTTRQENVDLVSLQMDYIAAHEDLNNAGVALIALDKTARDLEKAERFSKSVAKTDERLASVVAHEMVSLALANIGQDAYADAIAPAHEDVTVAEEGIKDTLKSVWEKTKEYAKKVWEFIRNLIMKAVDFVKGIFGKEGSTADELDKLLKKLKEEKRTSLETTEFDKATRDRLAAKVSAVLIKYKKDLTGTEYKNFIDEMSTTVGDIANTKSSSIVSGIDLSGYKILDKAVAVKKDGKITLDNKTIQEALVAVLKKIAGTDEDIDLAKNNFVSGTDKEPFETYKDEIDTKISDYSGLIVKATELRENKVGFTIIVIKDKAVEAYNDIAKESAASKIKPLISDFFNNVEVVNVEIKPEKTDYETYAEHVVPLDFSDAETVIKELKDKGKKAVNNAEKVQNVVEKMAKDAEKQIDKLFKDADSKNDGIGVIEKIARRAITLEANFERNKAKGFASTLLGLARNNIGDVIKESARLYKKP